MTEFTMTAAQIKTANAVLDNGGDVTPAEWKFLVNMDDTGSAGGDDGMEEHEFDELSSMGW